MQCITNYWPVLKDITLTITPIIGAYVALKGLSTWSRQLKGSVEYELARRILKCTYSLREAFRAVRNPIMLAEEMVLPEGIDTNEMPIEKQRFYGRQHAYQRRWEKLNLTRAALQTELLEAEVVWGEEIIDKFSSVVALQNELWRNVYITLAASNPDESQEYRSVHQEMLRNQRDITYDYLSEEDLFTQDMKRAIEQVENYLKPHLRK